MIICVLSVAVILPVNFSGNLLGMWHLESTGALAAGQYSALQYVARTSITLLYLYEWPQTELMVCKVSDELAGRLLC